MDPLVILLVAGSAVLHVAWNVRLKAAGDPLITATVGLLVGSVVIVPVAAVVWWASGRAAIDPTGVALGLVSGAIEALYFVLLAAAYRRGDLSVVYPIARGTAPLLLVAVGVTILGERLGAPGWLGVALLLAGFLALQRPWRALRAAARRSADDPAGRDLTVAFAFLTGVAIAGYTSIDRVGTRLVEPVVYAAILWVSGALLLVAWVRVRRLGPLTAGGAGAVRFAAVGGVLTLGAYLLVLTALSVAPLTAVAPLRESATVVAAAWGAVRMGEASGRRDAGLRVAASAAIVAGALLLALEGGG